MSKPTYEPIDPDVIRSARQVDLPSFLQGRGEPLKRAGTRFRHKEHDSLLIRGCTYAWNSRNEIGNSLDFVMSYYGWTFEQALFELVGYSFSERSSYVPKASPAPLPKRENSLPKEVIIEYDRDCKRIMAYLSRSRFIAYELVLKLVEMGLLRQDSRHNGVFRICDEEGKLVGAELVGTISSVRWKSFIETQKTGYGFNVTIGEPLHTYFFESPIEVLSFWTIHKESLSNFRLVSLAGVRVDIFETMLTGFHIDPTTVFLCVNRDKAGFAFIEAIQDKYEGVSTMLPPEPINDWNDYLKDKCMK